MKTPWLNVSTSVLLNEDYRKEILSFKASPMPHLTIIVSVHCYSEIIVWTQPMFSVISTRSLTHGFFSVPGSKS